MTSFRVQAGVKKGPKTVLKIKEPPIIKMKTFVVMSVLPFASAQEKAISQVGLYPFPVPRQKQKWKKVGLANLFSESPAKKNKQ